MVYVFGLGHIGLPMAAWIALKGHVVTGIDANPMVIHQINEGTIPIQENYQGIPLGQLVQRLISEGKMRVTHDFLRFGDDPAVFVIAVGITTDSDGHQDLTALRKVIQQIKPALKADDLLIFRTTMIPGTCAHEILPQLQSLDSPIYLAYSPETISETHAFEEFETNPIILGAANEGSLQAARQFLSSLGNSGIWVAPDLTTAEFAKVAQNIIRDVNIALANEISEAACILEIDPGQLRQLINTHPRVVMLETGPGVGGYCLPNALGYLESAFPAHLKPPLELSTTARRINVEKPAKVVAKIQSELQRLGKAIDQAVIGVAGLAMKDFCADYRCSPAIEIATSLTQLGADVRAYDPLVPRIFPWQKESLAECLSDADCLLIAANQEPFTWGPETINPMKKPPLIIDTRNVFPDLPGVHLYRI